jgi:DNA gyrase inhibitor GyrI
LTVAPFDGVRLAGIAHQGNYNEIGRSFERVVAWANARGLDGRSLRSFGIYYDDPQSVPTAKLRSDACVVIPVGFAVDGGARALEIAPGVCASVLHRGPYAELARAYRFLYGTWLPTSGRERTTVQTHPPDQRTFDGRGVLITIQVTDAAQACDRLKACGVPIVYDLKDEAWGQRRFVTRDPGGALNLVDVVQQTEPQPGYWERYLPR